MLNVRRGKSAMKKLFGLLAVLLAASTFISFFNDSYRTKYRLEEGEERYFTKHHFTESDMDKLTYLFGMKTTPSYINAEESESSYSNENLNYGSMKIESTDETQKAIMVLNFVLFDQGKEVSARKLAEQYGFSFENRITIEWFDEHISEAIKIINSLKNDLAVEDLYYKIIDETTYTPHRLTYTEMETLRNLFFLNTEGDFLESMKTSYTTADIIEAMNYLLFTEKSRGNQEGIEKATKYGLSETNTLTFGWVKEHPKEMLEIKEGMENYGEVMMDKNKVREIKAHIHKKRWVVVINGK